MLLLSSKVTAAGWSQHWFSWGSLWPYRQGSCQGSAGPPWPSSLPPRHSSCLTRLESECLSGFLKTFMFANIDPLIPLYLRVWLLFVSNPGRVKVPIVVYRWYKSPVLVWCTLFISKNFRKSRFALWLYYSPCSIPCCSGFLPADLLGFIRQKSKADRW